MTLYEAFLQACVRDPSHPAVIDNAGAISYSSMRDNIGKLSNLYQAEIPKGARVALLSGNSVAFAQTFLAISNSGATLIVLDPKENDESIVKDLRQLSIGFLLASSTQYSRAQEIVRRERLSVKLAEIERRRAGEYDTSFRALPDRPIKDSSPFLLLRQEPSPQGARRYCAFSHSQLLASVTSLKFFYRLTPTDRMLVNMSWAHPFALTHGLILPILCGATAVVDPESASVEEFVDFLAAQRITRFAGPPKFYFTLLKCCAARKYTLPGVKSITVGMGSLSLALRKTYLLLKIPVLRCYGRLETVWSLAMDEIGTGLEIESARSRPAPGVRFAVFTEDGEEIPGPDRREGRLAVTSESLAKNFFGADNDENSAVRGTWLMTDEIARLEGKDDEVSIAVLGRMSDMLHVDGQYLSPRKIDGAALKANGVEDAAGFVRLTKNKGPAFACALLMKTGRYNEKELLEQIRSELPDEYQPETVHIVNNLPRDAFDSVNRLALQRQFSSH